jgi:hypothetical protein
MPWQRRAHDPGQGNSCGGRYHGPVIVTAIIQYLMKRAALATVTGRYRDPANPLAGRFTRREVAVMARRALAMAELLIPAANLEQFCSRGNRFNTALGIYSLAWFRALREQDIDKDWAITLVADSGWRLYTLGVNVPLYLIRPFTRNPQTRLNFLLRVFLFFPFAQDPRGYQRTYGKEADHFRTDWSRCVVYEYFKAYANEEEREMFRKSWCLYDFALPRLVHPDAHYERPHTLSAGDPVCDMRWYGRKPKA